MIAFAQLISEPTVPLSKPGALQRALVEVKDGDLKTQSVGYVLPLYYGSKVPYHVGDKVLVALAYDQPSGGVYILGRLDSHPPSSLVDSADDVTFRSRTTGGINLMLEQPAASVNVGSGLVAAMQAAMMHLEASLEIQNLKAQVDALTAYLGAALLQPGVATPLSGAAAAVNAVAIPITGGKASLNLKTTPGT